MRGENEETIFLKDYAETPYVVEQVELDVRIAPDTSTIRAFLTLTPRAATAPGTPLVLDGEELTLRSIAIDGLPLALTAYETTATGLVVHQPPNKRFVLETEVAVEPEKNLRLMGFYRSSGTWCTQCEPEGFRRITYYYDRPDVLAPFKVRMTADRKLAPVLLSNGNLVEQGTVGNDQHYAVWEDPFPKPAYLFAMVAGDLGSIHDEFTTASGRKVALGIYCTHGKESECLYAMDSLKRSMAWDERRFGREYDLDIFNIVAVSDFNFGAMENKGLNIFNDKLVFAKPETATDADYINIESVIAHEYFHNWTGDRITCRDWFQLCLKEGLTVYRDQEFSMDERSRPVNRIEDVRQLRQTQFPEDGGPLAHPPRPDRYKEINNFYTATIYEKGAEVVRMLATLLGEAGFRRGMDLYFERHDGEATTIEAFIKVFEDSSGQNLQHFQQWYLQAGTPELDVRDSYDPASQTYTLELTQTNPPTPGQPEKQPLVLPIKFGLIGPNGSPMSWASVAGAEVRDEMIVLDRASATVTFTGIPNKPVPSLLRGFSAPVTLTTNATEADQLFLARHDSDPFNRWQALQDVAMKLMVGAFRGTAWTDAQVGALAEALEETLNSKELDAAYKALAMSPPNEQSVARTIEHDVDPDRVHAVRGELITALVARLAPTLEKIYLTNDSRLAYSPDFQQTGRRSMKNTALSLLVQGGASGADKLAREQYERALNMTDRLSALSISVHSWTADAQALLGDFRTMYTADPLVLDKWLALNAGAPDDGVVDRVRAILAAPDFPQNNPNRLRALMATFGMNNPTQFARADGAGFRFLAEFVGDVDKRNPQVAARVLTAFRVWRSYEPGRRAEAEKALKALHDAGSLSRNTADILERTLAG
ncbi:aminopeptidase N [Devosia sp. ZB163]|uniref:aminopeptidase N n=1 Tax=Devosia sp. ZB163 TaxID=3025938 RepID=UPI00235DFEFC|nr:aminopeptidase N [Devosia sp. ZB163]MDC9823856.1 aminopeptidase N [Devosia sp. ZB163]